MCDGNNCGMVTYCLGSARQKRAYFKNKNDAVYLDNAEVLFCASENGRNYFAYGAPPFPSFTAEEYLKYRMALRGESPDTAAALKCLGINRKKRLGSMCAAELRGLDFIERAGGATERTVVVNLDGAKCTRKNRKVLAAIAALCKNVYVCVTDARFVRRHKGIYKTLMFGKPVKKQRAEFYSARLLAQKLGAYKVGKF